MRRKVQKFKDSIARNLGRLKRFDQKFLSNSGLMLMLMNEVFANNQEDKKCEWSQQSADEVLRLS